MRNASLWIGGGLAGVLSICGYLVAILVPWPDTQFGTSGTVLTVSLFPVMGIIYAYGLRGFIAAERDGAVNTLAFVFAALGFTTLLSMLLAQLSVGAAIAETTRGLDDQIARAIRRGLRLIDLGLDVAWDLLIGTALILWGLAMRRRSGLGPVWGYPSVGFGVALIVLNGSTFPTPPANAGLFDIGPFIAVFMLALAVRLTWLGLRARSAAAAPAQ